MSIALAFEQGLKLPQVYISVMATATGMQWLPLIYILIIIVSVLKLYLEYSEINPDNTFIAV
jgi:hypothetical protein